ncbi:MAG TPA: hypothetical protein VGZ73_19010 [Bryobacteraceae bacterium]|jgi:hypothetical protein|nr:hypothetical protein [Bryobacteraceae bacterium]
MVDPVLGQDDGQGRRRLQERVSAPWYPSSIPSTVVAALVNNHVYPDPDFRMNLRSIPGTTYNIGQNFSNIAMPADSPFAVPWWFRTEFKLAPALKGKRLWLNFDAINWLQDRERDGAFGLTPRPVHPVLWEDNYFELMPHETREIAAGFHRKLLGGAKAFINVDGWNQ